MEKKLIETKFNEFFPVTHVVIISYRGLPKDAPDGFAKNNIWELCYVDRGDRYTIIDGQTYYLKAGQGIFYPPNVTHILKPCTGSSSNVVNISFKCPSLDKEFFGNKVFTFNKQEKMIIADIVSEGLQHFERVDNNPKIRGLRLRSNAPPYVLHLIKASLECLLLLVYRKHNAALHSNASIGENRQNQLSLLVQYAIEFMYSSTNKKLSISDIAKKLLISSSYLRAVFKKETGKSIMDYYNDVKTEQAKVLIREESYSFTEIAEILGFSSVSYFSYQFRKKTNMTPTEYAKLVNPDLALLQQNHGTVKHLL